jgi:glycosyltransferase involved in cell wall biosynthesis
VLGSRSERDLSRAVWLRKRHAWRDLDITAVAPSRWLAGEARRSSLFRDRRVEVIPYGIDTTVFKPMDGAAARDLLNLPQDGTFVMFGAHDDSPRKGMGLLVDALRRLSAKRHPRIAALVAGPRSLTAGLDVGMPVHALGRLRDPYAMAAVYSAADVVVVPSAFENLPLVGLEAMACGTPVVGFDADTGIVDIVDHEDNGYLAAAEDTEDLARGIEWAVADPERHARLSGAARAKAEREYTLAMSARRYADLFAEVLAPA